MKIEESSSSAIQQFTDNIERAFNESQTFEALRNLLQESIIVMALVALLSLLILQILKLPLRNVAHRILLRRWLKRRSVSADRFHVHLSTNEIPRWLENACPKKTLAATALAEMKKNESKKGVVSNADVINSDLKTARKYLSAASFSLQDDFFLKQIQNLAQEVMDNSCEFERILPFFAHGASADDLVIHYRVDWLAGRDPDFLGRLTRLPQDKARARNKRSGGDQSVPRFPEELIAAQDNIAAAVERNLDDLQVRLMTWWPVVLRSFAVITGMVIALAAGIWLVKLPTTQLLFLAVIGLAAGYLASIIYELFGLISSWLRPRH